MKRIAEASPRLIARIAGAFYVMVFVTGIFSLLVRSGVGYAAALLAGMFYIVVTLLFYYIFKAVNRRLSLLAVVFSLLGIIIGPLSLLVHAASYVSALVFFGFYCLLIGYLIFRSTFLPRILGVLMAFAGLGWLTFLSSPLANHLSPYIFAPGILGEGSLSLWLLVIGVNVQ